LIPFEAGAKLKTKHQVEQGDFGHALQDAMDRRGMTLTELSEALGTTYEHGRKVLKTMAFPSRLLLEKICNVLEMNLTDAKRLVTKDKLKRKFGNIHLELAGIDPRFEDIQRQLPKLNEEQLRILRGIVTGMVDSNRLL
jgi:transcriptional regulator with XRE-family HTH domain